MKSLLIVNPIAGQGRPSESLSEIEELFRSTVRTMVVTAARGDAEAAAFAAAEAGDFDEVLVAGGDGTLNEVVNGLVRGSSGRAPTVPLGVVPLGTQNVLAQELGLPIGNLPRVAEAVRAGHTRVIDVGESGGRYFTLMAGFGFDAAVVNEVIAPVKEIIGPAAYSFAILGALAKYHSTSVRLVLDDEPIRSEAFAVIVCNASSYAFRQLKLAPFASLDDGWLDICVFERPPFDRVGFATQMMAVVAGRHLRDPRVRYYRARRIEIHSDPPIRGQIDGDMFESTPVSIRVVPRALRVYVPAV